MSELIFEVVDMFQNIRLGVTCRSLDFVQILKYSTKQNCDKIANFLF